jgi:hypothetical protein
MERGSEDRPVQLDAHFRAQSRPGQHCRYKLSDRNDGGAAHIYANDDDPPTFAHSARRRPASRNLINTSLINS